MLPVLITCGLIMPANLSTAAVLFTTCLTLMIIGRVSFKYISALIGIGVVAFALFVSVSLALGWEGRIKTWVARVESFMDDTKGSDNYQSQQASIAIAKGGVLGCRARQ
jgi:cell division protein FtsW